MKTDSLIEMEVGQRPGQPEVQNVSKKSPDLKLLVIFPCPRNGGGQAVSGVMEKHVSYTFQQPLFNPQVSRPLDMTGAETGEQSSLWPLKNNHKYTNGSYCP